MSMARETRERPVLRPGAARDGSANEAVEGIVNHHLLTIHHVRTGDYQTAWDLAFLAFGGLLVVGGWLLARSEERDA
jgi:uncharacterized membrane protein